MSDDKTNPPIQIYIDGGNLNLHQHGANQDSKFEVKAFNATVITTGYNADKVTVAEKLPSYINTQGDDTPGDAKKVGDVVDVKIKSLAEAFGKDKQVLIDTGENGHVNIDLPKGITYTDTYNTYGGSSNRHQLDMVNEKGKHRQLVILDATDITVNGAPLQTTPDTGKSAPAIVK